MFRRKYSFSLFANIVCILCLLILPYLLFDGKLYIGGDDTRLFYSYPLDFLRNVTYFSWVNNSSIGINGPSQYLAPFLVVTSVIAFILQNEVMLNYLALSLPLILGFLFFQKVIRELFKVSKKNNEELIVGGLFYVLSPILVINQMFVFLISIWLIGLIPIICYYFVKYLRTSSFKYIFITSIWCLVFSFALYAIPWLLGFILPIILGLMVVAPFFAMKEIIYFAKHSIKFFGFIVLSQAFWLTGFVSTYLNLGQDSFASKFLSQGFIDTYTPTVVSTATGTVMYPLLNLFHRQIPFDFGWKLKNVFEMFYDRILILNIFYVLIFAVGIFSFKKALSKGHRRIFLMLLVAFAFSLYFFTVNIGPLKHLFIAFKHIPGFIMFRNFYDKFAPGYVIIYASLCTISLILVTRKFEKYRSLVLTSFLILIFINFIPVRDTVNSPLWTTESIYKTIIIPQEYQQTMDYIRSHISPTNNILSIPFGSAIYTVIKDKDSNNVYVGASPVKLFSGVNDISGHLSFNFTKEADIVDTLIANKKYAEVNKIMYDHNINYILHTRNIPKQVLNSWVFSKNMLAAQDQTFLDAIVAQKIYESPSGAYAIYKAKKSNSLLNTKNLYFQKISQVKYRIYIKNISEDQAITFMDSYHAGWNLFLVKQPTSKFCTNPVRNMNTNVVECQANHELFNIEDFRFLFVKSVFRNTHTIFNDYANLWEINAKEVKSTFDKSFKDENDDGTVNIELILYFIPQLYFYIGVGISICVLLAGFVYLVVLRANEKK